ncbi:FabD/lysophospholipase-like protein [Fusarium austroafricanum]|uniref:Lysophospholipase n=1 Tax=Fusarium austroafricanum TaxID=2364996 RepID=A0A8H4KHG1_9HYPO|nr:FabD/lysophospholipase-like protein [Fusarium austroafricanum]
MVPLSTLVTCLYGATVATASSIPTVGSAYAPKYTTCPSTPLVRGATGISAAESSYITQRHRKASAALKTWLRSVDKSFDAVTKEWSAHNYGKDAKAPVVALTSSGGGYRAMLSGAGVIKAFDGREKVKTGVSGLYQALTYEAGLSGGSWLLSSLAANDYPTISSLQKKLWEEALESSLLVTSILVSPQKNHIYDTVEANVKAKQAAGFEPTIIDPWGRLLAYGLLYGKDGGVHATMSSIAQTSSFREYSAAYPIITTLGVETGSCIPERNATQYEFHPYEFGSWDAGVAAFAVSKYLGTSFSNGRPTKSKSCITNYDQLSYVLGTSSNVFAAGCEPVAANNSADASLLENFAAFVSKSEASVRELFGLFPNPFQGRRNSPEVSSLSTLELVDGGVGVGYQGNPIWPFLYRSDVDVIIVNENSADTENHYPNGTQIVNTYKAAMAAGLKRMPPIPPVKTFVAKKLNQKPTFFGCYKKDAATIIFIPNFNYTFESGQSTNKIQYYRNETVGMIDNGVEVGNYGGKDNWPLCLACGIMKKQDGLLPKGCVACFKEYCFN